MLELARLGPSGTGPSRTVRTVLVFWRTGPFTDGPIPSVFLKNITFYTRLGPEITYTRPHSAVPDVYWRSGPPAGPNHHMLGPSGPS